MESQISRCSESVARESLHSDGLSKLITERHWVRIEVTTSWSLVIENFWRNGTFGCRMKTLCRRTCAQGPYATVVVQCACDLNSKSVRSAHSSLSCFFEAVQPRYPFEG